MDGAPPRAQPLPLHGTPACCAAATTTATGRGGILAAVTTPFPSGTCARAAGGQACFGACTSASACGG